MFSREDVRVRSVEELIRNLERVDESALQSDHRETVRAELGRMRKNLSAVLAFVSHCSREEQPHDPQLGDVLHKVRRECLLINRLISRMVILQMLPVSKRRWVQYTSPVLAHYAQMTDAARQMCLRTTPQLVDNLLVSF
jgi:hypothetical protein